MSAAGAAEPTVESASPSEPSSAVKRPDSAADGEFVDSGDRDLSGEFDSAATIESHSRIIGCTSRGDVDTFKFKVPPGSGGQLSRIKLRGKSSMAPRLYIHDAHRKRLLSDSGGEGEEIRAWVHAAGGSEIYLRVGQIHRTEESYVLEIETAAIEERGEPNGDLDQATRVSVGGKAKGIMGAPANDRGMLTDWYRIDLKKAGKLMVALKPTREISPRVELHDDKRKRLDQDRGGTGEQVEVKAKVFRGTYYVSVSSARSVRSAGTGEPPPALLEPYVLTVAQ